jgi:hypothetical protein
LLLLLVGGGGQSTAHAAPARRPKQVQFLDAQVPLYSFGNVVPHLLKQNGAQGGGPKPAVTTEPARGGGRDGSEGRGTKRGRPPCEGLRANHTRPKQQGQRHCTLLTSSCFDGMRSAHIPRMSASKRSMWGTNSALATAPPARRSSLGGAATQGHHHMWRAHMREGDTTGQRGREEWQRAT